MTIHSKKQRDALIEGGQKLGAVLQRLKDATHPGVTTAALDKLAESLIREAGGVPSFKGYKEPGDATPYPSAICTSVNDEVVHAIPANRILCDGDIIGIDIGMKYKEFFTDMAVTVPVGTVPKNIQRLLAVTHQALDAGIRATRAGNHIGDIGYAISAVAKPRGYGVVRELVGHGVGEAVHEDPYVPNYGRRGTGQLLIEGMVLALEPMFTLGKREVTLAPDGWAWVTQDGSPAAHFEHTIVVTKNDPLIVTELRQP